jgi:hypothetical protein
LANDIIEKIKNANENSLNVFRASKFLNKIELFQTENIKNQCETLIFIVTQNYFKSELYAQHLNEAIKLNKSYFFLVQDIIDFNETHVEKNKVFKLNKQNLESSFMIFFYDLIESTKKVRI